MVNVIKCGDLEELASMIALLQERGLKFEADATLLKISITGY